MISFILLLFVFLDLRWKVAKSESLVKNELNWKNCTKLLKKTTTKNKTHIYKTKRQLFYEKPVLWNLNQLVVHPQPFPNHLYIYMYIVSFLCGHKKSPPYACIPCCLNRSLLRRQNGTPDIKYTLLHVLLGICFPEIFNFLNQSSSSVHVTSDLYLEKPLDYSPAG